MTKAQIIQELKSYGEVGDFTAYSKAQLEQYLNDCKTASKMSLEELEAEIRRRASKI